MPASGLPTLLALYALLGLSSLMSIRMPTAIRRALKNIVAFGDTDVFPFPFERYLFDDKLKDSAVLLERRNRNFDEEINAHPPINVEALAPVGYTGFRNVTLIEPLWNAYYLALVISMADEIESARPAISDQRVFSYRYGWNDARSSLFQDITWNDYRRHAVLLSQTKQFVVVTDIADHYARVNHHRLENALKRNCGGSHVKKVMRLLQRFSNTRSYGLPVGGPASRMLAELSLVDVDRGIGNAGISFVRYADDYTVFTDSKPDAYKALMALSDALSVEGLTLQKHKTRIMSASEFRRMSSFLDPKRDDDATDDQRLLHLAIKFDPYSPTAEEDYDNLKAAVSQIDVLGVLSREVAKTAIDQSVTRQAIGTLRALIVRKREAALKVLLDPENLQTLLPVFPHIMRAVRGTYDSLTDSGKTDVACSLLNLGKHADYVLNFDLNLAYFVQALSRVSPESDQWPDLERLLVEAYDKSKNALVRRLIVHAMGNSKGHYFVSRRLQDFNSYQSWERHSLLVSSYSLTDEGTHWRRHNKRSLTDFEQLVMAWAAERHNTQKVIPV